MTTKRKAKHPYKAAEQLARLTKIRDEMMVRAYVEGCIDTANEYKKLELKPIYDFEHLFWVARDVLYFDPIKVSECTNERVRQIIKSAQIHAAMWSAVRRRSS